MHDFQNPPILDGRSTSMDDLPTTAASNARWRSSFFLSRRGRAAVGRCLRLLAFTGWLLQASAQADPGLGRHQWFEFSSGTRRTFSDLAQAEHIVIAGERVTAETITRSPNDTTSAYVLFEDDAVVAEAVRKAMESQRGRWIQLATGIRDVSGFANVEDLTSVSFGSDEKGEFARVILRGQSVVKSDRVAKDESAGYLVREAGALGNLKAITANP